MKIKPRNTEETIGMFAIITFLILLFGSVSFLLIIIGSLFIPTFIYGEWMITLWRFPIYFLIGFIDILIFFGIIFIFSVSYNFLIRCTKKYINYIKG